MPNVSPHLAAFLYGQLFGEIQRRIFKQDIKLTMANLACLIRIFRAVQELSVNEKLHQENPFS
tara:strand:+ start:1700 stop:1888 length:189 start_codon:yes stop_codon:yes gene_type:complete